MKKKWTGGELKMGKELPLETLANMIETNQVAIKQLGQDIKRLERKLAHKELDVQDANATMRRDIADRWKFISDLGDEFKKLGDRVKELESKKAKT